MRQTITRETGLPISFGLSVNKMVSKVATNEAKPNGQLQIPRGSEREFIAPMSIGKLPMVGEKTFRFLRGMGIAQVWAAIGDYMAAAGSDGIAAKRRHQGAAALRDEVARLAIARLRDDPARRDRLARLEEEVAAGAIPLRQAARDLLDG